MHGEESEGKGEAGTELSSHPAGASCAALSDGSRTPKAESSRNTLSGEYNAGGRKTPDFPTPPGMVSFNRPSSAPSEIRAYEAGFSHIDRVIKSGWLLKAFGGVSLRTWKRRWVYLLDDRLCWAPEEGSLSDVRYISLDRIPVRPAPKGYGPELGVTRVESSLFPQSRMRVGCMFSVTSGSKTHHFCSDNPEDAGDWLEAIKSSWHHCVTHSARRIQTADKAEFQLHKEQQLMAQNNLLHSAVRELTSTMGHIEHDATCRLQNAGDEVHRLETMLMDSTDYIITVHTGNRKGAGTDSNVYVQLIGKGEGRVSGELALMDNESGTPPFRRAQADTFRVRTPYLGPILQLRLWHDGTGRQPHWFVEGVTVVCEKNGRQFLFPCRQWFSTRVGDARILRTLYVGRFGKPTKYEIKVFTSNLRGAGTDANVHIVLYGDKGTSGRHILSSGPDDFERGARNEFVVEDIDVGQLRAVVVGHDNSGAGASWHLDHIVVSNPRSGAQAVVPGRCWFADNHGDGATERMLEVASALQPPTEYIVSCVTSDIRGAGTDADVFVVLHGAAGSSPRIMLPSGPEDFERGTKSAFAIATPDVGDLQQLTVSHNNKGAGPSWHLRYVEVAHSESGVVSWFLCNQWLAASKGDGQLERTLMRSPQNPDELMETYDVEFHTSDLRGAGTEANVYYILHGSRESSGRQAVKATLEAFDRGSRDCFVLACKELGELQRCVVGHDNSGSGPSWHLDRVQVTARRSGAAVTFPCCQWLSSKLGDGSIERELLPEGKADVPATAVWEVAIQTSDIRGAGMTDGAVFVELMGVGGGSRGNANANKLSPRRLEDSYDNFTRGKLDCFRFEDRDIGKVGQLEIYVEVDADVNSNYPPSWHVETVTVRNVTSGEVTWFIANRWLSSEAGLRASLTPSPVDPSTAVQEYKVLVYTGNMKGAGTDSGVTVEIIGSAGSSGARRLTAQHDTFERGQCDEFRLRLFDLGVLSQVVASIDGKGLGASWYLDHIVVEQVDGVEQSSSVTFFPAGVWLGGDELQAVLHASRIDPRESEKLFSVAVHTSNLRRAGTDSNVFVQVIGNLGEGPEMQLRSLQREAWERGQVDECEPLRLKVGVPEKLRIWHDNKGLSPAWHLHQVVLTEQASGERYYFLCDSWLEGSVGLERCLSASKVDPSSARREYVVEVVTSDLRGAGTDATVSIELHGDAGSSGMQRLENSNNVDPFERGMTDTFRITCRNLGGLRLCRIGHDVTTGRGSSWHLWYVKVTEAESRREWFFNCDRWLDAGNEDDGRRATCELVASTEDPSKLRRSYKLRIHTSDIRGAGTDANVFVILRGSNTDTGKKILHAKGKADFERGQIDEFDVTAPVIGRLESIRIGHDNKGSGASWHCKQVDVQCPEQGWVTFPCNRWFDASLDDGAIERDLYPAGTEQAVVDNTYQIVVHTSDCKGAGTDATVFMELKGVKGKTGPLKLDESRENFERGKVDTFTVTATDVGTVEELRVWHDNRGIGPAWHLDTVEVYNTATNSRQFFECSEWLDKAHGIEKRLVAASNDPTKQMVKYKIVVHTSDIRGAGTDANVFIDLHGDMASSGKIVLDDGKNPFERGMINEFVRKAKNLGNISSIVIGHDAKGIGAAWHLQQVEVSELTTGKRWYFDCREWLDNIHGTSRQLKALSKDPRSELCQYKVSVKTSDIRGAGTDANVFIVVYGERGDTGKQALDTSKDNFERNTLDSFTFQHADIGEIQKIRVGHDNTGMGAAWHCDTIQVANTSTGAAALFQVKSWFDKKQGDGKIEREFTLTTADAHQELISYDVTFVTGDERGAGTDADVSIVLIGSHSTYGPHKLDAHAEHFERGRTDVLTVEAEDVGKLQQLEVIADGSGLGAAWLLSSVEVHNRATGERTFFPCDDWLDKKHGLSRVLSPGRRQDGSNAGCTYKLEVKTSDIQGAGTDANVTVTLFGDKGKAGPVKLTGKGNLFERNRLDVFTLKKLPDTGRLTAIQVEHDGRGFGAAWHLAELHVHNLTTGDKAYAVVDRWLDSKAGDGSASVRVPLVRGSEEATVVAKARTKTRTSSSGGVKHYYRVEVETGSEAGAGDVAESFINIMSSASHRETGPLALRPSGNRFTEGGIDSFRLDSDVNVTDITHVDIGHYFPEGSWFVERVTVSSETTGQKVSFPCQRWLHHDKDDGKTIRTLRSASPQGTATEYVVEVATGAQSTVPLAQAGVFVDIIGEQGRTGRLRLSGPEARFQPSGVDTFTLNQQPEVGIMQALDLGYSGEGGEWHCEWVQITNSTTRDVAFFPANVILSSEQPLTQCVASQTDRMGNPRSAGTSTDDQAQPPPALRSGYQVTFQTKRSMCSGARGQVSFDITGERGSSGRITVESTRNNFKRGSVDSFFYPKLMFLGNLTQMRVHLKPRKGLLAHGWELEGVTVTHTPTGKSWVFYYNGWVSKAVGYEVALMPVEYAMVDTLGNNNTTTGGGNSSSALQP